MTEQEKFVRGNDRLDRMLAEPDTAAAVTQIREGRIRWTGSTG